MNTVNTYYHFLKHIHSHSDFKIPHRHPENEYFTPCQEFIWQYFRISFSKQLLDFFAKCNISIVTFHKNSCPLRSLKLQYQWCSKPYFVRIQLYRVDYTWLRRHRYTELNGRCMNMSSFRFIISHLFFCIQNHSQQAGRGQPQVVHRRLSDIVRVPSWLHWRHMPDLTMTGEVFNISPNHILR